jgi:hypothetical protein
MKDEERGGWRVDDGDEVMGGWMDRMEASEPGTHSDYP